MAEASGVLAIYSISYRNHHVKVVEGYLLGMHLSRYCTMRSDLCKKCTSHFTRQFSFFIYIGNMSAYNRSVSSKQFCHLVLGKPHGIFFQLYFKLCISIISRIEHDR